MRRVEEVPNFFFSKQEKVTATEQLLRIKKECDEMSSKQDAEKQRLRLSNHTLRSQRRTTVASSLLAGWLFDINNNRLSSPEWPKANTMPTLGDTERCKQDLRGWLEFPKLIAYSEYSLLKILQPMGSQWLFLLLPSPLSIQPCRSCSIHLFLLDCNRHLSPKCWVE